MMQGPGCSSGMQGRDAGRDVGWDAHALGGSRTAQQVPGQSRGCSTGRRGSGSTSPAEPGQRRAAGPGWLSIPGRAPSGRETQAPLQAMQNSAKRQRTGERAAREPGFFIKGGGKKKKKEKSISSISLCVFGLVQPFCSLLCLYMIDN